MDTSYYCKITDISLLNYFHSDSVRWLNTDFDYDLIKDYFSYFNVHNTTDTYFGISLDNMKEDWTGSDAGIGKLCAYIEDNEILAFAAVEYADSDTWELRAVSTRPDQQNKGFSKYVCSFIVKYILDCGRKAICETNISNFAMQMVTKNIGMIQYKP